MKKLMALPVRLVLHASDTLGRIKGETAFSVAQAARDMALRCGPGSVINTHLGGVNFPKPHLFQEGQTLFADRTDYTSPAGSPATRENLAAYFNRILGLDPETGISPHDVIVLSGKGSIFSTELALVKPGQAVHMPAPGYPIYESMTEAMGGKAQFYEVGFKEGGELEVDLGGLERDLAAHEPEDDILVILNDHHNPTGKQLSVDEVAKLETIAQKFPKAVFFFDGAYFRINYTDAQPPILQFIKERLTEGRGCLWHSFSKEAAMPAIRMGAMVSPPKSKLVVERKGPDGIPEELSLNEAVLKVVGNSVSCPNSTDEAALGFMIGTHEYQEQVRTAYKESHAETYGIYELAWASDVKIGPKLTYDEMVEANVRELRARRDLMVAELSKCKGVTVYKPDAGFYVEFEMAPDFFNALGKTPGEVGEKLLEKTGIPVCNQTHFSDDRQDGRNFFRLAFSNVTQAEIQKFMPRLAAVYDEIVAGQSVAEGAQ